MKKLIFVLAVGALMSGCSSADTKEDTNTQTEITSEVSVADTQTGEDADIYTAIGDEAIALMQGELVKQDFSYLENYYGFDENDVEGFSFVQAADPVKADTFLLINAKSPEKAEEMRQTIETVRENAIETYKSYAPDQADLLTDALIKTNGSYVYYVVSEKSDDVEEMLSGYIS